MPDTSTIVTAQSNNSVGKGMNSPTFNIILTLLCTVAISLSTWTINKVHDLDVGYAVVQSNRFTSADGVKLAETISKLADKVHNLEKNQDDVPPKWFYEAMRDMESEVQGLSRKIDKLENYTDVN